MDELNDLAKIRIRTYQKKLLSITTKRLEVGDLVIGKVFQNRAEHSSGKLAPKWYYIIDS